tara:strand:+ start:388 stop:2010 length:1623 start_codon:yes stop_codon:yes gene_type:complete
MDKIIKKEINGAELLVNTLKDHGVKYIFGVPGDIENVFFKHLKDSEITFFNTMHEQSGAMMADVYSRLTGEIGVCFSTLGPGATNMVTGIANAYQDRSSVLALSGQLPLNQQYRDSHQYVDLVELYKPITKKAHMVHRAKDIHSKIHELIQLAKTESKGPVHVSLPVDILSENAEGYRTIENTEKVLFHFDEQLGDLYEAIKKANSVVAIVGNGVIRSKSGESLAKFLEEYNIPFFSSFQGKGAIPSSHPLNCGVLSRHSAAIKEVLRKQDLIITFGYDVIEGVTQDIWKGAKKVAHIGNNTPSGDYATYNPDIEIIANMNSVFEKLSKFKITKKEDLDLESMRIRIEPPEGIDFLFPLHPAKVIQEVGDLLEETDIVISDVGLHKQAIGLYLEVQVPNRVIYSNGLSTMGFALPASIAAKLVSPNKKVVAICGDGGFQMNIQELATAIERKLPIVCIVMNDEAYGMVKNKQLETFGNHYGAEFIGERNFASIAKGFGTEGFRITKTEEFKPILKQALESNKVCVIDVPVQQYNDISMMK